MKLDKGQLVFLVVCLVFGLVFPNTVERMNPAYVEGGYVSLAEAEDGTYSSTAMGYGGDITVDVTIKDGKIFEVTANGPKETEGLGSVACEKLPGRIVGTQSLDIELVAGATVSSTAIIKAANIALAQAKVDGFGLAAQENNEVVETKYETLDCDVVVVGAGGAGLTAASFLAENGKSVILLEKMSYVGGNTLKASGGMNAADTKFLDAAGITDSTVENFIEDTMNGGHQINNIDLVRTMAESSSDAIDWLDSIGAPLPKIAATGGTTHKYLHEPEDGSSVGKYLVKILNNYVGTLGNVNLMLETEAKELISENGQVKGVIAEGENTVYTINSKAVILATGGFGSNKDMLASYDESLRYAVSTNTPAATGDGIVMAQAVGADTVDMEQIQLHPTVYQSTGALISEAMRSAGGVLVNAEGNRFVNDLSTRDVVSQAELKQTDAYAYIILDQALVDGSKKAQEYVDPAKEMATSGATYEELAANLGFDETATANFVKTMEAWNDTVNNGTPDEFGRNNGLIALEVGPFYAIKIAPGIHHTMGGVKINTSAEVLNTANEAIPGLYAAGEVAGGVHGGNRIGGNAVTDIVVYGRIAAQSAIDYIGE